MIFIVGQMKLQAMARPIIAGKIASKSAGFTYLLVLGFVLIVLLSLGKTSEHILLTQQREREAELIFIGKQYQAAITRYYNQSPNGLNAFPTTLESLVDDKRSITTQRHLRKLYKDPMTGSNQWGLVKNDLGQITGVYSQSDQVPIKKNIGFLKESGKQILTYADWKFEYVPETTTFGGLGESATTTNTNLQPLSFDQLN